MDTKGATFRREYDVFPERRLWKSVLAQVLIDAIPLPGARRGAFGGAHALPELVDLGDVWEARRWLSMNNRDFVAVCTMAGRDPSHMLRLYQSKAVPEAELLVRDKRKAIR